MPNDDAAHGPDAQEQPQPAAASQAQLAAAPQRGHFASFKDEVQAGLSRLRAVFAAMDNEEQPEFESLRGLPGEAAACTLVQAASAARGMLHDAACAPLALHMVCHAICLPCTAKLSHPWLLQRTRSVSCPHALPHHMHFHNVGFTQAPASLCPASGVVLEPMSWEQLASLVAEGSERALGTLGRHPAGIRRYWHHRNAVLLRQYASGALRPARVPVWG